MLYIVKFFKAEKAAVIVLYCYYVWKQIGQKTNRFYHRSSMQIEISQIEGKRIMTETRFTEFLAFSVDPSVGISQSAWETDY